MSAENSRPTLKLGRYLMFEEIAAGGMATVHLGRQLGPLGFSKNVAIKRLHAQYARDPDFVSMFLDEARIAARIEHPNVVSTLDVVTAGRELFLIMEYVHGESLSTIYRKASRDGGRLPPAIASAIVSDLLSGLEAAHNATDDRGEPLHIVHRDVSPHNILVGVSGVSRVLDFGVAQAAHRSQSTREGQLKGKLSYMAPEQLSLEPLDRRADVFAAGIILWELLTGRRLFAADSPAAVVRLALTADIAPPSSHCPNLPSGVDELVLKALARERDERFGSALQFARGLEQVIVPASRTAVGDWVREFAHQSMRRRDEALSLLERRTRSLSVEELDTDATLVPGLSAVLPRGTLDTEDEVTRVAATGVAATGVAATGVAATGVAASSQATQTDLSLAEQRPPPTEEAVVSASEIDAASPPLPRAVASWIAATVLAGMTVAAVALVWRFALEAPETVTGAAVGHDSSAASAARRAPASAASPPASTLSPPSSAVAPLAPAPISTSVSASPSRAAQERSTRPALPKTRPRRQPKPDCNPPYTLDEFGAKRFNPACFR